MAAYTLNRDILSSGYLNVKTSGYSGLPNETVTGSSVSSLSTVISSVTYSATYHTIALDDDNFIWNWPANIGRTSPAPTIGAVPAITRPAWKLVADGEYNITGSNTSVYIVTNGRKLPMGNPNHTILNFPNTGGLVYVSDSPNEQLAVNANLGVVTL